MKTILFDYGGTLDSDGSTWIERFSLLYREQGIDVSQEKFNRAFYDSDNSLPVKFSLAGLNLEDTLRLQVREVMVALAPDRTELAGTIAGRFAADSRAQFRRLDQTLEHLAQRYRLGVVSNFYGNLDGILQAEGLRHYFDVVADSGVLGVTKPSPEIFLHAARTLNSVPEECVMVGDSVPRDMHGAAGVGMKRALVCARHDIPQVGQDWTIRSVVELESIFS